MICAKPPKQTAAARITVDKSTIPALCKLSNIVVAPNPKNPKGGLD
ncbi:hypothetical protein [Methanobrevibacter arboriphilus]|nr:hypothetical protein [Methanobrevibacter arboriphilus]